MGWVHPRVGLGNVYWAFTRYDRRTDWSARPRLRPTGLSDQSDRPVGQTVAEPPIAPTNNSSYIGRVISFYFVFVFVHLSIKSM